MNVWCWVNVFPLRIHNILRSIQICFVTFSFVVLNRRITMLVVKKDSDHNSFVRLSPNYLHFPAHLIPVVNAKQINSLDRPYFRTVWFLNFLCCDHSRSIQNRELFRYVLHSLCPVHYVKWVVKQSVYGFWQIRIVR